MRVCRRCHSVRPKAFTLLELILVMIILCTVLAMAAPSLRGFFTSHQLNDMCEQVLVMTRYAKSQAVFEGINYRVNFDPDQRLFWLSSLDGSMYERLRNNFGNYFQIPPEVEMDFYDIDNERGIYYLQFNPLGYSSECRIRLQDNQDNILEIVCDSPGENYEIVKIYNNRQIYVQ